MTNVEFFHAQLEALQTKHNLSSQCTEDVKQICIAHAINCSMEPTLLEYSSKWLVNKIIDSLENTPQLSAMAIEAEMGSSI